MRSPLPALRYLLCVLLQAAACQSEEGMPFTDVPVSETLRGGVERPVEILRDLHGIPHIYAESQQDLAFAQGYVMATDRLFQMDMMRRVAAGTLAELVGGLDSSVVERDIAMRLYGLRRTSEKVWEGLQASQDALDQKLVKALGQFAAGVNRALFDFRSGQLQVSSALVLMFDPASMPEWTPVDSLTVARFMAFNLAFDANTEISRTQAEAAAFRTFDQAADPSLRSRRGLASDLYRHAPLADAFILPDAQGCVSKPAVSAGRSKDQGHQPASRLYDWASLQKAVAGIGIDRMAQDYRGSNNWVVGPEQTRNGNPILSNDTHLSLTNPAVFYQLHLSVRGEVDAMGVQFPGLPGIVIGMNQHLAWGTTTTNADVTDVYEEKILSCEGQPCVEFRDQGVVRKVLLVKRVEEFGIGLKGKVQSKRMVTLWDVPHHGPILPRIDKGDTAPLRAVEISARYTGYEPTSEFRAAMRTLTATTVEQGMEAMDQDFHVGSQNWIFADRSGKIGWTNHVALPLRPKGTRPWLIQPGDGSVEWQKGGVPPEKQPRLVDPACGFIVTANNDPLGATSEAGAPADSIYHGWDYDPGGRAYRITERLREELRSPDKITVEEMQALQGDHRSFLGQRLGHIASDAGSKLLEESMSPGKHPDLGPAAQALDDRTRSQLMQAVTRLTEWKHGTPSGMDNEAQPEEVRESIATSIFNVWLAHFHRATLNDEFAAVDQALQAEGMKAPRPGSGFQRKLLVTAALHPEKLAIGRNGPQGDSLLFDDLGTSGRTETLRETSARSLVMALAALRDALGEDMSGWQWGKLHRLTLQPLLPVNELLLPPATDPAFPKGVPRHGDLYAVDVGSFGYGSTNLSEAYAFAGGAAIRLVVEMTKQGPRAWNVLPGGQVFEPDSSHYADQFALWRHNKSIALPYREDAVKEAAKQAHARGERARTQIIP